MPVLRRKPRLSPPRAPKTVILTKIRTQSRTLDFARPGNNLRRSLGPGLRRDDGVWGGCLKKTYPHPSPPGDNALGFRDGRHELSHLCPEASGACPRLGCDSPKLRQGVRPGRGALNDRPHLPDALESVARASGKSPRTGCRGHHGHRRRPPGHPGVQRHPVPSLTSAQMRTETKMCAVVPASADPHRRHPTVAAMPRSGGPALPRRAGGRGPPDKPGDDGGEMLEEIKAGVMRPPRHTSLAGRKPYPVLELKGKTAKRRSRALDLKNRIRPAG